MFDRRLKVDIANLLIANALYLMHFDYSDSVNILHSIEFVPEVYWVLCYCVIV